MDTVNLNAEGVREWGRMWGADFFLGSGEGASCPWKSLTDAVG